jgi:hypothetical protein
MYGAGPGPYCGMACAPPANNAAASSQKRDFIYIPLYLF